MERVSLKVEPRDRFGKGPARALRREGGIPAVIYHKGESQSVTLDRKEVVQFIRKAAGEQAVVNLELPSGRKLALMKEYQSDPVKNELMHVDFVEVSLTEKVTLTVPVTTVGEPVGVKRDKGILQQIGREVEIECLPDRIPGHIEIDISALETGHSLHVSDLAAPEGVTIVTDPEEVICSVMAPTVEEEAPAEEELEEVAPGGEAKAAKEEAPAEGEKESKKEEG